MHSINPFLRAFFRSNLPSQCSPVNQHILLVPITEVLLTNKDSETDTLFTELVATEEFTGSHVLKVPPTTDVAKENGNVRESRNKAKQFTTLNGRTVVIKESYVYSNKGFKSLNQAQLLSDALFYNDALDAPQWLIYYISRPLVGSLEAIEVTIAKLSGPKPNGDQSAQPLSQANGESAATIPTPSKKPVNNFNEVLIQFPMIARQMQPGLDRIFRDFNKDIEKPLPAGPRSPSSAKSRSSSMSSQMNGSVRSGSSRRHAKKISIASTSSFADDEEDHMRTVLESAINAAIDNFQLVDKQQLSLLGTSTELTGSIVEKLIERHVTEHVNDNILFPRLSAIHQSDDNDLESRVHHMMNIDVAQVGIEIGGGPSGKREFTKRLNSAIEEFRKLGTANGPQQMLDILLETQKILSGKADDKGSSNDSQKISEKASTPMNADTLVSLLLLVVIRSQVRHLQARLAYMRNFVFIDDVEGGELGYALSTFEAVLQYIVTDAGGLKIASRRNKRLWQATKKGNLSEMRTILEPDNGSFSDESDTMIGGDRFTDEPEQQNRVNGVLQNGDYEQGPSTDQLSQTLVEDGSRPQSANLSHVFPFQVNGQDDVPFERPKAVKRVSMDLRSLSGASEFSFHSRTSTINSRNSILDAIEGDTSIEKLCQTEDPSGDSVLMMAVEAQQPESLAYLLSLEEYYSTYAVLEDANAEGKTLLSAAVQTGNTEVVSIFVDYVFSLRDVRRAKAFLAKQDNMGRTCAHYLFHAPPLIHRFGTWLPWRVRDKNGVTPLLALCRSYDHPQYLDMVNQSLQFAVDEQGDGQALHMDNHIDSKGNTLLHAVSDPYLALRILQHCDLDPNTSNNKLFTPLMMASKFGRFDLVRTMILDHRVDSQAKEYRGMTAVELAKDDDVRNRFDDMILVSNVPAPDGRVTAIVRSFFVEDGSVRMVIKTATKSDDNMISVTTCRRSVSDFEHLAKWLSIEHPASWLPSIFNFRSPFQIPSKPSRAVLHDIQVRLNKFLKIMLAHSTFSTHELLWEFILMPEIQPDMMAERSLKKSELRQEKIREEYSPIEDVRDVESFVTHARESIRPVNHAMKSVIRRVAGVRNASRDLYTSLDFLSRPLSAIEFLPSSHKTAFTAYTRTILPAASDPFSALHASTISVHSTILSILSSLSRPHALVNTLQIAQKTLDRHRAAYQKTQSSSGQRSTSGGWPSAIPAIAGRLLEDSRKQAASEAKERMLRADEEVQTTGSELTYTYQIVAGELAGWQELHGKLVLQNIRELARGMVIRERGRLEGMKRALRAVREANQGTSDIDVGRREIFQG